VSPDRSTSSPVTRYLTRPFHHVVERFGRGVAIGLVVLLVVGAAMALSALGFVQLAAPTTLTITSGPKDSAFERYATRYQAILKREGVTLRIEPSEGSRHNLERLSQGGRAGPDVGFVLGGETKASAVPGHLVSLGSLTYQPLMLFYRGPARRLLSDFEGLRLDIGPPGSGAHALARALLEANGVKEGDGTTFVDTANETTAAALLTGRIDAFFAMSDSTPSGLIRGLMRAEGVHLFAFEQADGYARRFGSLNKLVLPRGAIDLGEDIPAQDVPLVGPTVELIARDGLHPALVDLLLEAAKEVHGPPGLYRKRGEFPAPLQHEFRISDDARRYYASGKSFLYRTFPFWLASLVAKILAVLVPLLLLLVPALRVVPALYRWHMTSRIYRWYGALRKLEQRALVPAITPAQRETLAQQLDDIEAAVQRIEVPAAFGDLFYGLRGHVGAVRQRLLSTAPREAPAEP
jgi:hypothetical protein